MIKKINVTCEKCKESFIFTSESSLVDKILDAGHYICFTCEDSNEEDTLEEIALAFGAPFTADKFRKEVGHILENSKKYHGIFTLQERCDRYEKALEDIRTNTPIQELLNLPYGCACHEIASDALAAIGGDDE